MSLWQCRRQGKNFGGRYKEFSEGKTNNLQRLSSKAQSLAKRLFSLSEY